jgi:hypothetical protein
MASVVTITHPGYRRPVQPAGPPREPLDCPLGPKLFELCRRILQLRFRPLCGLH